MNNTNEEDLPYLMRGRKMLQTESTALISSSKYLNDYRIREWVTNQCLKRNGQDVPGTYGIPALIEAIREVQDHDRIEALFDEVRVGWPELDRWLDERWLAKLTREDIASCPPGSIGGILYAANLDLQIIDGFEPRSSFEYFFLRGTQTHDMMHVLSGGEFGGLGEIIPAYLKYGNLFRWLPAELAGLLNVQNTLLSNPVFMRGPLHYPELFPLMWDMAEYGMRVGRQSEALFLPRYEDFLDLPLEEARRKFGVGGGARDYDTRRQSAYWEGRTNVLDPELPLQLAEIGGFS
jgi:ubiquinone biosynthesis protein COQ4